MTINVVLVEDDPHLATAICQGLQDDGIACRWSPSAEDAWPLIAQEAMDVVVLDLMLPGMSGLEFLERVRANRIQTPVLILTALGSLDDRVNGLNAGADDYLVKPFEMPELSARITAIARRNRRIEGTILSHGPLRIELTTRRAFREGKELALSPTELSLLELLVRHADQIVTRRMLCEQLWDASWEGETNVIEVHINRLRGKLDRAFDKPLIHTVRGRGYQLSENVPLSPSSVKNEE